MNVRHRNLAILLAAIAVLIGLLFYGTSRDAPEGAGPSGGATRPVAAKDAGPLAIAPPTNIGAGDTGLPQDWIDLLDRDPGGAMAKAAAIARETGNRKLLFLAGRYLLTKDFSHAALVSRTLKNGEEFQHLLVDAIPGALAKDLEAAIASAAAIVGQDKNHALRLIGQHFLQLGDFSRVMAVQEAMPFSDDKEAMVRMLFGDLAHKSPADAFAWLPRLDKARELPVALQSMQLVFVKSRSEENLRKLLSHSDKWEKWDGRTNVISALGYLLKKRGDLIGLETLKNELPDHEKGYLVGLALSFDAPVKNFVTEIDEIKDRVLRHNKIMSFVRQKTSADPMATAGEIMELSSDADFRAGYSGLIQTWIRMDSEGMSAWVQKLPPGPRRDMAIREFAIWMNRIDKTLTRQVISWHHSEAEREATKKLFGNQIR
jgi:hypothetical protein